MRFSGASHLSQGRSSYSILALPACSKLVDGDTIVSVLHFQLQLLPPVVFLLLVVAVVVAVVVLVLVLVLAVLVVLVLLLVLVAVASVAAVVSFGRS